MTAFTEVLEAIGSFLVGLGGRFGLFLVAGLVLLVPALVLGAGIHLWHRTRGRAVARTMEGLAWRRGAYHAPNHTWLAPRHRGELAVGIDDLARRVVPGLTWVELPARGMVVHRGDPIVVLRAGARAVRIGAPVDGTVLRLNRRARRDPMLVLREPYGAGWLFTLAPADGTYLTFPEDVEAIGWMRDEARRLSRLVEEQAGARAADGGALPDPTPAALGEAAWRRVVFAFLHAA